jgi:predicted dehydrogenase
MNILIVGSGMYVTGRNNSGTGTVLSSLIEYSKKVNINKVTVVSYSKTSEEHVESSFLRIQKILKKAVDFEFFSLKENGDEIIQELHKENPFDASIISIPDHLHYKYGKLCLELGIHSLIVKPLTPTVEEATSLKEIAEANNVFGCVEFHKRYDDTNLWIKKALEENKLGELNYFTVDYSQRISIPLDTFKTWSDRTNIFQYLGVHYVDLIYWLTAARPKKITAIGINNVLVSKGIKTYDSVHCTIQWISTSGKTFVSMHNTNWIDPNISSAMSDQKYKVIGEKGRIECDQKNRGVELVHQDEGIQQINPYFSDYIANPDGEICFKGYGYLSIKQFLDDLQELKNKNIDLTELNEKRPSFKHALISTAVIEAANLSMDKEGNWETINLK